MYRLTEHYGRFWLRLLNNNKTPESIVVSVPSGLFHVGILSLILGLSRTSVYTRNYHHSVNTCTLLRQVSSDTGFRQYPIHTSMDTLPGNCAAWFL